MEPILVNTNINLSSLRADVLSVIETIKPKNNIYDIIFNCNNFSIITDFVLNIIKEKTNENFDIYIKNLQSYIQTSTHPSPIIFDKTLKKGIKPISKYSFILMLDSENTNLYLTPNKNKINLKNGELIIFNTNDFIKDEFDIPNRIALIGSLTNELEITNIVKSKF